MFILNIVRQELVRLRGSEENRYEALSQVDSLILSSAATLRELLLIPITFKGFSPV